MTREMDENGKLPEEVFSDIPGAGFDFWHKPDVDTMPCEPDEFGVCHRIAHLFPLAKGVKNPRGKA